jgi:hypothetical protein
MNILSLATLTSLGDNFDFGGEEIGYGELGVKFRSMDYKNLNDFEENAPAGDCFESEDGTTFYKVRNNDDDYFTIYVEDGEAKFY